MAGDLRVGISVESHSTRETAMKRGAMSLAPRLQPGDKKTGLNKEPFLTDLAGGWPNIFNAASVR